jgi:hypothetical protein
VTQQERNRRISEGLRLAWKRRKGKAMKTAREIAARVWCDQEMQNVAMDVDAAEEIAVIIESVRQSQVVPQGIPNRRNFDDELVCLLNKYSKENGSNTPDFILADFIGRCLENWNLTTVTREEWYGRSFSSGSLRSKTKPTAEELDKILNSGDDRPIEILPDGSIREIQG